MYWTSKFKTNIYGRAKVNTLNDSNKQPIEIKGLCYGLTLKIGVPLQSCYDPRVNV